MPHPRPDIEDTGAEFYGYFRIRAGLLVGVFRAANGRFYTDHPQVSGPFVSLSRLKCAIRRLFDCRDLRLVKRDGPRNNLRGTPSPVVTEDSPPPLPPQTDNLVAGITESASTLTLQEADVSSSEELLPSSEEPISANPGTVPHGPVDGSLSSFPFSEEELVADAAESASAQTLQVPDVSLFEELLPSSEESIASSSGTVPLSTTDGSSSFPPFRLEKFMAGAAKSASAQTLQEPDVSSSKEMLCTTSSEELSIASPSSVLHDTDDNSPPSGSVIGPPILFRDPPNWYEEFYIRKDCKGYFHMYPDLNGPYHSLKEAEAAIDCHLNKLRRPDMCQRPSECPLLEWRVKQSLYFPDGTPKRGPNSPARKNPHQQERLLVKALLDQYNDYRNPCKDAAHELKDLLSFQVIFEDNKTYYHFNFTTTSNKSDDANLFFAEVWWVQKEDAWVFSCCCRIEPNDDGLCYGCCKNGSHEILHPKNTRAYVGGHVNGRLPFGGDVYSDSDDEDLEAYEARLRFIFGERRRDLGGQH
ncbi:unnamed protein product [Urochloa humidicola]